MKRTLKMIDKLKDNNYTPTIKICIGVDCEYCILAEHNNKYKVMCSKLYPIQVKRICLDYIKEDI